MPRVNTGCDMFQCDGAERGQSHNQRWWSLARLWPVFRNIVAEQFAFGHIHVFGNGWSDT